LQQVGSPDQEQLFADSTGAVSFHMRSQTLRSPMLANKIQLAAVNL
jgi:hypothetical protein